MPDGLRWEQEGAERLQAVQEAAQEGPMTPKARPTAAVVYCRVSVAEPASLSLDDQRERCQALALAKGWPVLRVLVDDGLSGARMDNRPALQEALDLIKLREAGVLIVAKIDRLTRSLEDLLALLKIFDRTGAALVSVAESFDTSTSMGRTFLQLLGVFSEFERGRIRERLKDAATYRKRQGLTYGPQVAYGLRKEGDRLVPVPEQMEVVKQILMWKGQGYTLNAIARLLNERGVPTAKGKKWRAEQIRSITRNDVYEMHLSKEVKA